MMETSQKFWVTLFLCGLTTFFYKGMHILRMHTAFTEFYTPAGVADIFEIGLSVTISIGTALKINIAEIVDRFKG